MENFFTPYYQGPAFTLFDAGHLSWLALIGLVGLSFIHFRKVWDESARRRVRWTFAGILIIAEVAWQTWSIYYGRWSVQTNLPLHLCSVFTWLSAYMLIRRSYRVYELAYFLGIGGAVQALLTPGLGIYGLPHFLAVQTLVGHGAIFLAPIYLTVVEGMRPRPVSLVRVVVLTNIYMVFVFGVNMALGSNYMFLAHKPHFPSLIDLLAPWPWYILQLQVIGLVIVALLYAPFFIKDQRSSRAASVTTDMIQ